jgi:hypothetical protein
MKRLETSSFKIILLVLINKMMKSLFRMNFQSFLSPGGEKTENLWESKYSAKKRQLNLLKRSSKNGKDLKKMDLKNLLN